MKQISIPTYASYSRDMTIVDAVDCELVSLLCSIWQPESVAIDLLFFGRLSFQSYHTLSFSLPDREPRDSLHEGSLKIRISSRINPIPSIALV